MCMRKNITSFLLIVTFVSFNYSCQKVVEIDLNKAQPKYVIEGNMSDQTGDCTVSITQSVNFSDPSSFPRVTEAVVTIQEDQHEPLSLMQTSPGLYESGRLNARPLHSYTLRVSVDGHEFTSTVTVPQKVGFDSLYIIDFNSFGENRKFANVVFMDPPGLGNAYRFIQYKNRIKNANIFVLNDEYSDGRQINTFLAFFDNSENQRLASGDTVIVEMQGIDPSVYKYFSSLNQSSTGDNNSVAPGNPVSNISGGALGYFNAFLSEKKMVIIP